MGHTMTRNLRNLANSHMMQPKELELTNELAHSLSMQSLLILQLL